MEDFIAMIAQVGRHVKKGRRNVILETGLLVGYAVHVLRGRDDQNCRSY